MVLLRLLIGYHMISDLSGATLPNNEIFYRDQIRYVQLPRLFTSISDRLLLLLCSAIVVVVVTIPDLYLLEKHKALFIGLMSEFPAFKFDR